MAGDVSTSATEPLRITLNGTDRVFADLLPGRDIGALVAALGFRADRVALERNGDIVPRSQWSSTTLASGDRIELVHFVGGGLC